MIEKIKSYFKNNWMQAWKYANAVILGIIVLIALLLQHPTASAILIVCGIAFFELNVIIQLMVDKKIQEKKIAEAEAARRKEIE